MQNKIRWITRTAIFLALLIVLQVATVPLGNTLITGSIVNFMLVISVMTCGLASGLTIAAISPVMAKFLGVGPLWSLIPFIAAGNIVLVLLWHILGNRSGGRRYIAYIAALLCAAVTKFLVLYIGIVKIAVPVFLGLPEQQSAVISNMFSIPQLFTALVGGAVASLLLPRLKKVVKQGQE
jgi:uncharacterized membrane protein